MFEVYERPLLWGERQAMQEEPYATCGTKREAREWAEDLTDFGLAGFILDTVTGETVDIADL